MASDAQALLEKEAGLQRAMELRQELSIIAENFKKDLKFELVYMQIECACKSLVIARNTFDELINFSNYNIQK